MVESTKGSLLHGKILARRIIPEFAAHLAPVFAGLHVKGIALRSLSKTVLYCKTDKWPLKRPKSQRGRENVDSCRFCKISEKRVVRSLESGISWPKAKST